MDAELRKEIDIIVGNPLGRERDTHAIMELIQQEIAKARINERNQIALDNYRGKTISESTNWQAMYQRFIDDNETSIETLQKRVDNA